MFILFGGLFFLLFGRILFIQITGQSDGHELAVEAAKNYQRNEVLKADRGRILDTNGNVIAEDILNYKMIAVVRESVTTNPKEPQHVVNPRETARVLAEYIDLEEDKIYEILTRDGDPYQVEFGGAGSNISHEIRNKILEHELPGIIFYRELKRFYPNGSFASYAIGFTQSKDQEDGTSVIEGKMGIEAKYNKLLSGKDGTLNYQKDSRGFLIPSSTKSIEPAEDGADVKLTIDKTIQNFLEDALSQVQKEYNPESVVAVVAEPKTGKILAMSQRPTFNPDTRAGLETWLNLAIEDVIEPGSTMKTFTLAAAVDSNNWHPNATYKSGQYTLLDRTIRDHNQVGWGTISYLEGFQRSSNTAMAYLLNIMGADTFVEYLDDFGFGKKTGVDLPKETTGTILTKVPINKLTTSYGQGSTVTPMQMIQAATAIANDGKMMQPYFVDQVIDVNTGKVIEKNKPKVKGEPITAKSAEAVREILASTVTSEKGTARAFAIDGYTVAGKTGTAQIPKEDGSGYYWGRDSFLYSFLGMAPAEDPQLVMYVSVSKPTLPETKSGTAPVSEIFNSVVEKSLKYLNIAPADVSEVELHPLEDYIGQEAENVQVELSNKGIQPIIIGEGGKITAQYPRSKTKLTKDSIVYLKTDGDITLPSFKGWSMRNILVYKALSELPIEIVGEGYVEGQSTSAGTVIVDSSPIVLQLRTPKEQYAKPYVEQEELEQEPPEE